MEIYIIILIVVAIVEALIGIALCFINYDLSKIAEELDSENDRLYDDMRRYRQSSSKLAQEVMTLEGKLKLAEVKGKKVSKLKK